MAIDLDGNPIRKGKEPAAAAGTAPANFVATLPKVNGKTTGQGPHMVKGVLLGNPPLEASGVYDSLVGAAYLGLAPLETADPTVNIELTIDAGRVRIYAEDQNRKGYVYAEALPGHPAQFSGRMLYGVSSFQLVMESVDGTATGLHYHVIRASH